MRVGHRLLLVTLSMMFGMTGSTIAVAQEAGERSLPTLRTLFIETDLGVAKCTIDPVHSAEGIDYFTKLVRTGRYAGTSFCRMVPTFFVQGGCVHSGDEKVVEKVTLTPAGSHSAAGVLSLAANADGTFGQAFVILERPAPWLDGRYVVLGQCGPLRTIRRLSGVPTLAKSRARRPVEILSMEISGSVASEPVNGLAK